jgi:hypothetical protein
LNRCKIGTDKNRDIAVYMRRNCKYSMNISLAIEKLHYVPMKLPHDLDTIFIKTETRVSKKNDDDYVKKSTMNLEKVKMAFL